MDFRNHIFRIYGKKNKVLHEFLIKDRTNDEASNEAMRYIESLHPNCDDWTVSTTVERKEALLDLNKQDTSDYNNDLLINDIAEKHDITVEVVDSFDGFRSL